MSYIHISSNFIEICFQTSIHPIKLVTYYISRSKVKEDWIKKLKNEEWWNKDIEMQLQTALDICREKRTIDTGLERELRLYMKDKDITSSVIGLQDMMAKGFAYASIYRAAKKLGMKGPHGSWIKPNI